MGVFKLRLFVFKNLYKSRRMNRQIIIYRLIRIIRRITRLVAVIHWCENRQSFKLSLFLRCCLLLSTRGFKYIGTNEIFHSESC